ncbi:autotransporter outer membrane beta-barrel domain-containing protein [Escherichia coli]|nr:autotransporter outer membrane beta-barrel domain-containing protein [Escherichia coli]
MSINKLQLSVITSSILFSPLLSATSVTSIKETDNRTHIMSDDVVNSNNNSNAVYADGQNSIIDTNGHSITASGNQTSAVNATNGGVVNVNGGEIDIHGANAHAISARQAGTVSVVGTKIFAHGINSSGIFADGGDVNLSGSTIITTNNKSYAAIISENSRLMQKDSSLVSKQYAVLNFAEQNGKNGAEAVFEGSFLNGNTAAIVAVNSVGKVNLMKSTVHSDMGVLADIGDNAEVTVSASDKSQLSGTTNVVAGSALNVRLSDESSWVSGGSSTITNLSLNNGKLIISGTSGGSKNVGNIITVTGDYHGNNGSITFNTVLAGDDSATDKLVVHGNTSGNTFVTVNQAGGTGAQTLNGIKLIHVDGHSDGEFTQTGRITAGAYDYTLERGQGINNGNWYLTSTKNTPESVPNPEPPPGVSNNNLRPEAGTYTANIAAANTVFVTRLHERSGKMQYIDVITGEQKETSMWMRHAGGHNRWHDSSGQLKTRGNRYVLHLGGDLAQWSQNGTDGWHLGGMGGYANDHNSTKSIHTGYRSKGGMNGYTAGLYATWYADDETYNGAYLDTWAQFSWFNNHVKGDGLPGESWKSKGFTVSLETGYTRKAGEFTGSKGGLNEWYVQPQAQVVWMDVKAGEHRESNGTHVESTGNGNVRTRLGVKTWIKSHNKMDEGTSRTFSPFVEVNWLHNTRDFGSRMNGVTVYQNGSHNAGEVKAGVEGQINSRLNLWGHVGVQSGHKGYNDTSALLGVKYFF